MYLHALENNPEYIELQTEMVRMQNWLIETGNRPITVYEGRDSAGKYQLRSKRDDTSQVRVRF